MSSTRAAFVMTPFSSVFMVCLVKVTGISKVSTHLLLVSETCSSKKSTIIPHSLLTIIKRLHHMASYSIVASYPYLTP